MTTPRTQSGKAPQEPRIDEMIDETFPASDAPALTPRGHDDVRPAAAPDAAPPSTSEQIASGAPPTIGNQGTIPASGVLEETVPLTDQGVVHLRFDGGFRHLHVYLGEEGMALDGAALDRLIAVLSQKRARLQD